MLYAAAKVKALTRTLSEVGTQVWLHHVEGVT